MQKKDYYEVLGVPRSANESEIKRAFRTMARKYHPDVNKDPGAEDQFKIINEAYEVLNDPQKRQIYDQYGHAGIENSGFHTENINPYDVFNQFFNQSGEGYFGGDDLNDLFGNVFGQNFGRSQQKKRNPNQIEAAIEISFVESIKGCNHNFRFNYQLKCEDCDATGALDGKSSNMHTCNNCNGSGYEMIKRRSLFGIINTRAECKNCSGSGRTITKKCKKCSGKGYSVQTKELDLAIKAGIEHGSVLMFKVKEKTTEIEIIVKIYVHDSQVFERHGLNIYTKILVNPLIAIAGGEVKIPSPWGIKVIRIKPGTKNGEHLKIIGAGVKLSGKKEASGDLIGIIEYTAPPSLNQDQIKTIQNFNTGETKETKNWINKALKELE